MGYIDIGKPAVLTQLDDENNELKYKGNKLAKESDLGSKITFPENKGTSGQVLKTDGNDNPYWGNAGGSGGGGTSFTEVTEDVYEELNALIFGETSINSMATTTLYTLISAGKLFASSDGKNFELVTASDANFMGDIIAYIKAGNKFYTKRIDTFFLDENDNSFMPAGNKDAVILETYTASLSDSGLIDFLYGGETPMKLKKIDVEFATDLEFMVNRMTGVMNGTPFDWGPEELAEMAGTDIALFDNSPLEDLGFSVLDFGGMPIGFYITELANTIEYSPFYDCDIDEGIYFALMNMNGLQVISFLSLSSGEPAHKVKIPSEYLGCSQALYINVEYFRNSKTSRDEYYCISTTKYSEIDSAVKNGKPLVLSMATPNGLMVLDNYFCNYDHDKGIALTCFVANNPYQEMKEVGTITQNEFNGGIFYYKGEMSADYDYRIAQEYDSNTVYYVPYQGTIESFDVYDIMITQRYTYHDENDVACITVSKRLLGETILLKAAIKKSYLTNNGTKAIYRINNATYNDIYNWKHIFELVLCIEKYKGGSENVYLTLRTDPYSSSDLDNIAFEGTYYFTSESYSQITSLNQSGFEPDTIYYSEGGSYKLAHEYDSNKTYYVKILAHTYKHHLIAKLDGRGSYDNNGNYVQPNYVNIILEDFTDE